MVLGKSLIKFTIDAAESSATLVLQMKAR